MYEKDRSNLLAIIDSCRKNQIYNKGFEDADALHLDQRSFDAILMNFVVIGEAVSRLSDTIKSNHTSIPWPDIKGFRNLVAHDYFGVDAEEVWQIIHDHIPKLQNDINHILTELGNRKPLK